MDIRRFSRDLWTGWMGAPHKGRYLLSEMILKFDINLHFLSFRTKDGARLCFHAEGLPWGLWRGTYEDAGSIQFCLDVLRPGDIAVDIGANVGHFTVAMAGKVGPSGRVISVEPNAKVSSCVEDNVRCNGLSNVTVRCLAIGNKEATVPFFIPRHSSGEGGLGKKSKFARYASTLVECCTFATLMRQTGTGHSPVALVKIDVEGFEQEVFEGMRDSAANVGLMLFEYDLANFRDRGTEGKTVINTLHKLGFEVFRIDSGERTILPFEEHTVSADLVAARSLLDLRERTGYVPIGFPQWMIDKTASAGSPADS